VGESDRLVPLAEDPFADPNLRRMINALNQNISRINSVLYNYADYAVIGRRMP
jgi:hypothetical protein